MVNDFGYLLQIGLQEHFSGHMKNIFVNSQRCVGGGSWGTLGERLPILFLPVSGGGVDMKYY